MIKVRVTFVDDENGNDELDNFRKIIGKYCSVLNTSKIYKGRGESKFSNIYIDLEINKDK